MSELSGFTCMGSLTMNEKFSIPHEAVECGFVNFEFIVSVYYSNWIQCKQKSSNFESAEAMV